ncbi:protein MKS1-like [Curcuma longa]|uniref:protein MKS1-like n=1 Tax=Curcuma longa TaxID=136217 RepID=UPI003D9DF300
MDPSDLRPSPRRELQGPRPSPLKVGKESHKIRKPPIVPPRHRPPPAGDPPPPRPRDPVIIYTVSPKIIHIEPTEFMTLVQRLTGSGSSSADPPLPAAPLPLPPAGAISPAARIASFERSASASSPRVREARAQPGVSGRWEIEGGPTLDRTASFPGILSPVPASLPPISPTLFTPPAFDPGVISFLHDLSPIFANNNFNSNFFNNSPVANLLSTPTVPSPGALWDLMSQFPDI